MELIRIDEETAARARDIERSYLPMEWPCRKGCSDCCRRLASEPQVVEAEWQRIAQALDALPESVAAAARERIRARRARVCPLLDVDSESCLVYHARPTACRAHGFYADRAEVLGCERIAEIAERSPEIVWGNYRALDLAHGRPLSEWINAG